MSIQNSTFGFIDYFIEGTKQRVACQFFRVGKGMMARLDVGGGDPIITAVAAPMRAEVLGDFAAVLERYRVESGQVLAIANFWHQSGTGGGCALKLFRVAHHMRLNGSSVSQGLDATDRFSQQLRISEKVAAEEIRERLYTDLVRPDIRVPGSDTDIRFKGPATAPPTSRTSS
jgi:hypothetical protein